MREYNKYHVPESMTKLVSLNAQTFTIEFTGSFCMMCGYYDYFDDYRILLDERGVTTHIINVVETETGTEVSFEIVNVK